MIITLVMTLEQSWQSIYLQYEKLVPIRSNGLMFWLIGKHLHSGFLSLLRWRGMYLPFRFHLLLLRVLSVLGDEC
ncbi:hypothetical protein LINPERPRIM_LOCUS25315 [Linum perenne]